MEPSVAEDSEWPIVVGSFEPPYKGSVISPVREEEESGIQGDVVEIAEVSFLGCVIVIRVHICPLARSWAVRRLSVLWA